MFPPNSWLLQRRKYIGFFAKLEWKTLWRNCSEKREKAQAAGCRVVGSTYLVLKILPHAMSVQARDRADVLGTATLDEKGVGFYGYAFYDRFNDWLKAGDFRLHISAMYLRMKSATCCMTVSTREM
jgi:hypothetical protein